MGGVPSIEMFSGIPAQPKDLGSNCQTVQLILHLWVRGQLWTSGHWAPGSPHQARCTFWGNYYIYIFFLAQSPNLSLSLTHTNTHTQTGNRKWKWNTGWVGHSTHLSHISTVFVKKGSNLNKRNIIEKISRFLLPWKSFFLYCSVFLWSNNILALKKQIICQSTNKSTKVKKKMQKTKRKSVMCKPGPHLVTEIYTHGRCLFLSTFYMKGRLIFNHKPNLSNFSTFMPCQNAWIKPLCCVTDEASMLISNLSQLHQRSGHQSTLGDSCTSLLKTVLIIHTQIKNSSWCI